MDRSAIQHIFYCIILLLLQFYTICHAKNGSSWVAGKNPSDIETMMNETAYFVPEDKETGDLPEKEVKATYRRQIPRSFDARDNWPECYYIIDYKRDQGHCATCWANAAASVMSDRICIGSRGRIQVHISVEDIVTCCPRCTMAKGVCAGGFCYMAFNYWVTHGYVSGTNCESGMEWGSYLPDQGCKPYSPAMYKRRPSSCKRQCTNPEYYGSYSHDKHRGHYIYHLPRRNVKQMQYEIMNRGPVATFMNLYADYREYQYGVYEHEWGGYYANHFVKVIGWGREGGKDYWLIANSYGTRWGGLQGMFKVLRGENHCKIENSILAGMMTTSSYQYREWILNLGHMDRSSWMVWVTLLLLSLCVM